MASSTVNSNTSRPQPRADTGSLFRNLVSDTFGALLRLERRFDPWVRPAFDAVLRDPLARFTTALINMQRPNEGLKIASSRSDTEAGQNTWSPLEQKRRNRSSSSGGRGTVTGRRAHGLSHPRRW